ncbi:hypothetical protein [Paenibacillus crassostreae]|uniref:Uncharacterized protein n=1 Tax=Paenibacillus crassostreae TaxID=1763538 RepID=A0A167GKX5_9BACL|nr:hypothetical protein [Paenibacillus crassostreae]AOZ92207.1 hypothetical protein LPB68_08175 [Paenibacillus crassostreae]OAB77669.1 hypothetical protein PNBC_01255 [Paenibacillus crassostreae]
MKYILIVLVVGIVVASLVLKRLKNRKAQSQGNVIKFQKKSKQNLQKCSYCKKTSRLIFYASDEGTVVGVCKECRPKAKARDMLPI